MRRLLPLLAAALGMAGLLTGCAGNSQPSADGSATPVVVHVTISGGQVSPNGDRVDIPRGSQVELDIHADADGEIHVHSTPVQQIPYHAGTTQASLGTFTAPGDIVVESHSLGKTIVTLRVK